MTAAGGSPTQTSWCTLRLWRCPGAALTLRRARLLTWTASLHGSATVSEVLPPLLLAWPSVSRPPRDACYIWSPLTCRPVQVRKSATELEGCVHTCLECGARVAAFRKLLQWSSFKHGSAE